MNHIKASTYCFRFLLIDLLKKKLYSAIEYKSIYELFVLCGDFMFVIVFPQLLLGKFVRHIVNSERFPLRNVNINKSLFHLVISAMLTNMYEEKRC